MRAAVPILVVASAASLCACHRQTGPGEVADVYDNRADQIENEASVQPNPVAKHIYESRANAVRDEGEERRNGLEKAGTDMIPAIPAPAKD